MTTSENKKKEIKNTVKKVGNIAAIIAMGFVIARLLRYRQQIIGVWNIKVALYTAVSIVVCGVLVLLAAITFLLLTKALTKINPSESMVVFIYVRSNLYKYLPGNVMHYVGRNQIAVESEATHSEIATCTIIEMGINCVAGLLVGMLFSFSYVQKWMSDKGFGKETTIFAASIIIITLIILIFFSRYSRTNRNRIKQLLNKRTISILFLAMLCYIFNQTMQGILFLTLLHSMGTVIPSRYTLSIVGVYAFAWLVGFITPGAPGGLGVREAMLTVFLAGIIEPGIITAAAILNRIITTCGDVLAFGMIVAIMKIKHIR